MKVEESKLLQIAKQQSPKTKGSYAAARANGLYSLSILEYQSSQATKEDEPPADWFGGKFMM